MTAQPIDGIQPTFDDLGRPLSDVTFCVVDLETTGGSAKGGSKITEFGAVKVVSGNVLGQTRTATLVVEEKYLNFDRGGAYATAFLLALVSVACIVIVSIVRPKEGSR